MRKFIFITLIAITSVFMAYYTFVYYVPYSEGFRSGELIKISNKGIVFKTWEGEISQGISGAQIFSFSVLDKDQEVVEDLKNLQGHYVKLTYVERYKTFSWWGDSKYFITKVEKEQSPHFNHR
jgi:uncharacterized protein YwgA